MTNFEKYAPRLTKSILVWAATGMNLDRDTASFGKVKEQVAILHMLGNRDPNIYLKLDQQFGDVYRESGNITQTDVMKILGLWNSGYPNTGDRNSGYPNSGDRHSGYPNSGDRHSGVMSPMSCTL